MVYEMSKAEAETVIGIMAARCNPTAVGIIVGFIYGFLLVILTWRAFVSVKTRGAGLLQVMVLLGFGVYAIMFIGSDHPYAYTCITMSSFQLVDLTSIVLFMLVVEYMNYLTLTLVVLTALFHVGSTLYNFYAIAPAFCAVPEIRDDVLTFVYAILIICLYFGCLHTMSCHMRYMESRVKMMLMFKTTNQLFFLVNLLSVSVGLNTHPLVLHANFVVTCFAGAVLYIAIDISRYSCSESDTEAENLLTKCPESTPPLPPPTTEKTLMVEA